MKTVLALLLVVLGVLIVGTTGWTLTITDEHLMFIIPLVVFVLALACVRPGVLVLLKKMLW